MSRNKEYRLKRKSLRKDYIIQDKNLKIKTLYYRNETKRNKIEQLQQENKLLKDIREIAINYIDQVIMYKPCAREIDKELDTLIGILRGKYDEWRKKLYNRRFTIIYW